MRVGYGFRENPRGIKMVKSNEFSGVVFLRLLTERAGYALIYVLRANGRAEFIVNARGCVHKLSNTKSSKSWEEERI